MQLAFMIFDLKDMSANEKQYYLAHVVAPRPICFASTVDRCGRPNLSPFSFFNLFSTVPPIVIFSPARSVRANTIKHTLENVMEVPEVVINMVTYNMVQQVSLSSCSYPKEVDEFVKSGFTKEPATMVRPPMVRESLAKLECRVVEIKSLGDEGGAGQLVICEVLCLHVDDSLLTADKKFDQTKLELVSRLGGDWYSRVTPESLFAVAKPNTQLGIGMDLLPESIRHSKILTGNQLGQLANVHQLPVVQPSFDDAHLRNIVQYFSVSPLEMEAELHRYAALLLDQGQVDAAWQVLLSAAD
jgi:flavin reductase (DIM6/NTAB) family NADH-FMN oxidoreductase RutF